MHIEKEENYRKKLPPNKTAIAESQRQRSPCKPAENLNHQCTDMKSTPSMLKEGRIQCQSCEKFKEKNKYTNYK